MPKRLILWILAPFVVYILVFVLLMQPVRESLVFHWNQLRYAVWHWLSPPEAVGLSSGGLGSVFHFLKPTETPIFHIIPRTPTPTTGAEIMESPIPALPAQVALQGIKYVDQHGLWNYCGPSSLAMNLSYWGWQGTREEIGSFVKGDPADYNVSPEELASYVTTQTNLKAIWRVGGDPTLLKMLLANGFPVVIEIGIFFPDSFIGGTTWMGHYNAVVGYDDFLQQMIVMDPYIGGSENPRQSIPLLDFISQWRSFDYVYLVTYPFNREGELFKILGNRVNEEVSYAIALTKAEEDTRTQTGLDRFFAWFNVGTNRLGLQDYAEATTAYERAFALYDIFPKELRPFRVLWFETGPYEAFYQTGHYDWVITYATHAIDFADSLGRPLVEESFYWRAMAEVKLGRVGAAISDLRESLEYHPGYPPSVEALRQLGY
jgi:hypothetical protein